MANNQLFIEIKCYSSPYLPADKFGLYHTNFQHPNSEFT